MKTTKENNKNYIQMPVQAYIWANKNYEKLMLVNVIMDMENFQRKEGVKGQKTFGLVEFSSRSLTDELAKWKISKSPQMVAKWLNELTENEVLSIEHKSQHKGECSIYKINTTYNANNKNEVTVDFTVQVTDKCVNSNTLDSVQVTVEVTVDFTLPINNSINNSTIGLVGEENPNIIIISNELNLKTFSANMKKECIKWDSKRLMDIIKSNRDIQYFKLLRDKYNSDIDFSNPVKETEKPKVTKEQTYKKTKFHNFNETFDQYDEDEFNDMVAKSQKEKFGTDKSNPNVSASVMDDLKEAFETPTSHLEPLHEINNVITLKDFRNSNKGLIDKLKKATKINSMVLTKNKENEIIDLKVEYK